MFQLTLTNTLRRRPMRPMRHEKARVHIKEFICLAQGSRIYDFKDTITPPFSCFIFSLFLKFYITLLLWDIPELINLRTAKYTIHYNVHPYYI